MPEAARSPVDSSRLLLEINVAIVTHAALPELLSAVSACLRREIRHDLAALGLYEPETNRLRGYALGTSTAASAQTGVPVPLDGTVGGLAFRRRETVLRGRIDPEEFPNDPAPPEFGVRSCCAVPLASHGRTLGMLGVASKSENAFTETDAALLRQIANQVAIAVENARNFEMAETLRIKLAAERDRSQLLLEINNALVSNRSLRDLFLSVSAALRGKFHHDMAALTLYDARTDIATLYAIDTGIAGKTGGEDEGRSAPLAEAPFARRLIEGMRPMRIDRLDRDPSAPAIAVAAGLLSDLSVPMVFRGKCVGVLHLGSKKEAAFTDADTELLTQIASQVAISVENVLAYREIEALKNKLTEEKLYLEDEIRSAIHFDDIIGESAALKHILKQIERVAPTDSTILIRGETGTGKELIARAIHNLSSRRERTLVKVNCAAIPMGLLESELFGHERGAFTGAISQRVGRFELANNGTLFLDEVGDIPLELQPKLLRVLQEQQFERLGSTKTQQVNVRLVAATNAALEKLVADKQYRSDLYYRLNVFPVTLPPLRERPEDIPLLVRFFAQRFATRMKKPLESISSRTTSALTRYHWPGNIRELENVVERAVILSQGPELEIKLAELGVAEAPPQPKPTPPSNSTGTLESVERDHILSILEETKWTIAGPSGAAQKLGMKRTTLQAKMRKLGISRRG